MTEHRGTAGGFSGQNTEHGRYDNREQNEIMYATVFRELQGATDVCGTRIVWETNDVCLLRLCSAF